ncbi:bifunctional 3-dehydroquinate synthase/phosphatase [Fusobacterium vincentii 4_1_13]|uniref:3-dehydroquinate synthase n=2 Tax=Fusobacterium vincentii TaxID=155615 RepID=A0ABV3Y9N5_FUSVC|nr:3-dehydroquinate synthase [Fusobacterium vincentii]EEO39672.1 bifunctional 3-dehydroquinate synthase/phosphatase [Fusobacterium vincentii 4_1_13]
MKKIFDDIYVGSNIISILNDYTKDFDKILIFSNETIADLYFEKFKSTLNEKDKVFYFAIKDGEEYKNIENILPVYDFMLENNFSRKSLIISLGGGVICDMGGYISATYMRGIKFIQVPTSLLAQVDASVGGKVAINYPKCKNMIGNFKNPYRVIIDVEFLKTLPKREFKSGMGELLKHSFLTKDKSYLEYIENNVEKIKNLDNEVLENIVEQSIRIKKYYVDIDPFEKGERVFLNLGHTYAHALESFFDYKAFTHGEAVAKGVIFDLELSLLRGQIDEKYLERAKNIFNLFDIDTDLIYLPSDKFIPLMRKDKKNSFNKIITILLDSKGNLSKTEIKEDEIVKIIDKYINDFLRASIDIGTNSCRLLIVEVKEDNEIISFKKEIYKDLEIVKLGEDVNKNKFLKEEAIERTLKCLKKYRKIIDKYSIEDKNIICFATSATRDANNRDYFIKKVYDEAKIKINCISGDKEAYINFKGVISSFDKNFKENILVFDIGGGSTEFTLGNIDGIKKKISLNIGSIRITEKFFLNNEVYNYCEENRIKAKEWIKENLKQLEDFKKEDFILIGVAGTTTTQVSVREKMEIYDSEKIHLSNLTSKEINDNLNLFIKNINKQEIKGLDPKRKDVIIGGTIILKEILEYFRKDFIIVSENDNLMGAILEGVENK